MNLYLLASWGPDGEDDIVYLAFAASVANAGRMIDSHLGERRDLQCSGHVNVCLLLATNPKVHEPAVVSGPLRGLSGADTFRKAWVRESWQDKWLAVKRRQQADAPTPRDCVAVCSRVSLVRGH